MNLLTTLVWIWTESRAESWFNLFSTHGIRIVIIKNQYFWLPVSQKNLWSKFVASLFTPVNDALLSHILNSQISNPYLDTRSSYPETSRFLKNSQKIRHFISLLSINQIPLSLSARKTRNTHAELNQTLNYYTSFMTFTAWETRKHKIRGYKNHFIRS